MIATIVGSVVGLASSVATIWAVLEVYTTAQRHPGMPIDRAARIAAAKYGIRF